MGIRYRLQTQVIEPLQFRIDRLGNPPYQPLPWEEAGKAAKRDRASRDRWDAIERFLAASEIRPESALDLGCNIGFFSFSLAKTGVPTLGVEMDPRYFRIANYARSRTDGPASFLNLTVTEQTMRLLPTVDLTLLLAVWHHWVHNEGLDGATSLLKQLWEHTNRALIFESGENEMSPKFGLPPLEPTPLEWFANYLGDVCAPSEVVDLGRYPATEWADDGSSPVPLRSLVAVVRR